MAAIYRRELKGYFNTMIGYVIIVFLLAFSGIYFELRISVLFLCAFRRYLHAADRSTVTDHEKLCGRA